MTHERRFHNWVELNQDTTIAKLKISVSEPTAKMKENKQFS